MRSTFKVLFYLKRNKEKTQSAVPVMGRITVNGTISQFSAKLTVPERLWEVRGGRAKGIFAIAANSPAVGRPSSSLVIFRITCSNK